MNLAKIRISCLPLMGVEKLCCGQGAEASQTLQVQNKISLTPLKDEWRAGIETKRIDCTT